MKKTLLITLEYPPMAGGIASYTFNIAAHWDAGQIVLYAPKIKGDKVFDAGNRWKVYRARPLWRFFWPAWTRMIFQVWGIIRKEKIEALHIHHVLPTGYVGYFFKKIFKLPYTLFLHGSDVELATKNRWKLKKFERLARSADKIIVNSLFLKKKILEKAKVETPIEIVYPAPGKEFFTDIPAADLEKIKKQLALTGKKVIITVARMVDGKGYPHLTALLPPLVHEIPNLVWIIIGDGPKKKLVMDMIQKKSMQNVVRFMGVVPRSDLPTYYRLADAFVLLTHADESREEGWGTVFLEAAAAGLPVVAGRAGGVEEAVENLKTGLVVDIYETKSVVGAISELLKNQPYAHEMGKYGQDRVKNEFTWEKQIKKI